MTTSKLPRVIVAIALYATAVILVAAGSFRQIAVLAVAGRLVLYMICCLGVLRLRARRIADGEAPFVVPGGPSLRIVPGSFRWSNHNLEIARAGHRRACSVTDAIGQHDEVHAGVEQPTGA